MTFLFPRATPLALDAWQDIEAEMSALRQRIADTPGAGELADWLELERLRRWADDLFRQLLADLNHSTNAWHWPDTRGYRATTATATVAAA